MSSSAGPSPSTGHTKPPRIRGVSRRRQDMDLSEIQRSVNDRTAEDFYAQLMLNAVRAGTDPNDSDNEEEVEWYVAPTWDAKKAAKRSDELSLRLDAVQKARIAGLNKLRNLPAHKKLNAFDRIAAEADMWTGQAPATSAVPVDADGVPMTPKKNNHRQNASHFLETMEEHDDASQMLGPAHGDADGGAATTGGDNTTTLTTSPSYLRGKLRKYQMDGVAWMVNLHDRGINGILADEMGLGKTFQSVALLAYLKYTRGLSGPHLVVAPKSVLGNWFREFKKWCPTLSVFKFHGDSEIRPMLIKTHLKSPIKHDIVLTTYEMIVKEVSAFRRINWRYLVIDEAHKLKNSEAGTHMALDLLKTEHRLLVTGTPLQNDLKELWSLLHFLTPDLFDESEHFVKWFNSNSGEQDKEAVSRMHVMLAPLMLRRLKSEAATELPPKVEIYVGCRLVKKQRDWYLNVLAKDASSINRGGGGGGGAREKLSNVCMQLRKVCNHPYLFDGAEEGPPFKTDENIVKDSGKMIVLDRLLSKLRSKPAEKHKVLIFSQMTRVLDIMEDYLLYRGWKYFRIDGNTTGLDRDTQMAQFNNPNSDYFIFLLSTRAGGLGINLQTANHVILYDSDWNPQADLQAQDRAHRIGQTRPVRVYRFITDNTFEERIYRRALKKLYLDAVVVEQGRLAKKNTNASKEELMSMIKFGAADVFKANQNKGVDDDMMTDEEIDRLLEAGEAKLKGLVVETSKDTQANLATFKLGIDDSNTYEFEGINYGKGAGGGQFSKVLHVKLEEPMSEEDLMNIAVLHGEVVKVTAHPNGKEALFTYRSQSGATDAHKGLPPDWDAQYCTQKGELVVTGEMIDQGFEVGMKSRNHGAVEAVNENHLFELQSASSQIPLKLPKKPFFPTHQLYNMKRLLELHDTEVALLVRRWKKECKQQRLAYQAGKDLSVIQAEDPDREESFELTAEELTERETLSTDGFPTWTSLDFRAFKKALPGVRVDDYKTLAMKMKDVTVEGGICDEGAGSDKTEGEVRDYSLAFWSRGQDCLGEAAFGVIEKKLEWIKNKDKREAEKARKEADRLAAQQKREQDKIDAANKKQQEVKDALNWKMEQYGNPTEELKVKSWKAVDASSERAIFFEAYDNEMRCETVPAKVANLPENQFDVFFKTRDVRYYETKVTNVVRSIIMEKKDHDHGGTGWRKRKRDADAPEVLGEGADTEGDASPVPAGGADGMSPVTDATTPLPGQQ